MILSTFRKEANCTRHLLWGLTIPVEAVETLRRGLLDMDAVDSSHTDSIYVLDTTKGHSVVIVPRTGRVQLRLSYLLRIEERPQAALTLAQSLSDLLAG